MQAFVPKMVPSPGERLCRFVGDRVRFELRAQAGDQPRPGSRALLRTNLGRGAVLRREILEAHTRALTAAGSSWRDIPMNRNGTGWSLELPLTEVGYFKAKAYVVDAGGWQHWPDGPDLGISVHPDKYRTANILYCAFSRLFGPAPATSKLQDSLKQATELLDQAGYAVLPPSGKLRDLASQLPHIVERLGCRILHLLPVNPTPTTYARFGRFGSPYAVLDLTAVDPALVVFDRRTTGLDQFRELTLAAHRHGASVLLDIVINHTGWGSVLQDGHPDWFLRRADGTFASPGAWGVTWEDLVELKHQNIELWDKLSEIFLTWCRRGVDGFRCDAGYMVPVPAWQYIVARVQQQYPDTIFLLEGLGGAWEATEALLTEGGMQWAYSELFQNYSAPAIAGYLDHCLSQAARVGLLVHYSETHDNDRLAAKGRAWSLLRNRLCALTSISGGFGFTAGVEWLAAEKIQVHDRASMSWDNPDNLLPELGRLNQLLAQHPCFFDGASMTRISPSDSLVYGLTRESEEGLDQVLVLINTSPEQPAAICLGLETPITPPPSPELPTRGKTASSDERNTIPSKAIPRGSLKFNQTLPHLTKWIDLLGQAAPEMEILPEGAVVVRLPAAGVYCLSPTAAPRGLAGEQYRRLRAQASFAVRAIGQALPPQSLALPPWRELASAVNRNPASFLAVLSAISRGEAPPELLKEAQSTGSIFPRVTGWDVVDARRLTVVPPGHWLLIQDSAHFRATLKVAGTKNVETAESIATESGEAAWFAPRDQAAEATLELERYIGTDLCVETGIRFLPPQPAASRGSKRLSVESLEPDDLILLTNGRGGMARICVDLGRVKSKYDCLLGANLHPSLPVDRHVFAKRIRLWVNADGFLSPLDFRNLRWFEPGPPACWYFVANAGDGRTVELRVSANMLPGLNTTAFNLSRPTAAQASGKQLPETADVRLTVRVDIEDRNFHWETKRNPGADHHFSTHTRGLPSFVDPPPEMRLAADSTPSAASQLAGFIFTPAAERSLRVFVNHGVYHPQAEWSENIPHPVEQSRGQTGCGDGFSPGWFEVPLAKGADATLIVSADPAEAERGLLESARASLTGSEGSLKTEVSAPPGDDFSRNLVQAIRAFVVARGTGKTVIAGYPWFLDWGRDTFIAARGLLAAGMADEVKQLLLTFGRFENKGTLPNTIFGDDASNRDTSDAPLWFGMVCEEIKLDLQSLRPTPERSLLEVLKSIASHYIEGTPNGIRMDPASALVWSPGHFTWMDTNYPACTPREGYPIEIQALWIRLLRQLARLSPPGEGERWQTLADAAAASVQSLFWREDKGYYADVLVVKDRRPAREALVDDALRSNCLFAISLGVASGERARRCVAVAERYLVVPGALRSLAPLPVSLPLANYGNDGRLLNDPQAPYWGRYEGDEDTRRKPAYHNGTAWTWTLPVFCEALARAWDFAPAAVAAARAYLGTMDQLMARGCLGQLPEIIDGDAPHTQRGCDAQAWGATEALRVWKLLQ
jgi:predicted glycogen debranching enzyme